ncbi:hypothetical protein F4810DRAFT_678175 [Camillea tinctor]|nr:hypothetical protein F4810DRAFT_678175 [Camillea tinctor]
MQLPRISMPLFYISGALAVCDLHTYTPLMVVPGSTAPPTEPPSISTPTDTECKIWEWAVDMTQICGTSVLTMQPVDDKFKSSWLESCSEYTIPKISSYDISVDKYTENDWNSIWERTMYV